MFDLYLDIEGQDSIVKAVDALSKALNTQEILDEAAAIILNRTRYRYLRETSPDGTKWPPSQAALDRARRNKGGGTLYDTGRLFHSIQLAASTEDSRTIGTDVPYGKFHQFAQAGKIRREFMGVNEQDAQLVGSFIIQRIAEALNGL